MFYLESEKLRVEITEPGEAPNNRFRFDRAAFISEVIMDGMRFCASEPQNLIHPCSGGRGFCSEFRFDASVGAKPGEWFPKFGVGLIRKEGEEPYCFHKAYREMVPFPVEISHGKESAVFVTGAKPCLGYAMKSERILSVAEDRIELVTKVENQGEKTIPMEEFCHNFISIDGMAAGSDYELQMPQIPDLGQDRLPNRRGFSGAFRGQGHGLTFCEFTAIDTDTFIDGPDIGKEVPFRWRLSHRGAKGFVECEESFVPEKIAVWGVDHMLSPEVIHGFSLEPGQSHEWKRVWRFGRE